MKKFYVNCNSPQRKFVWPGKMMKIFVLALVAACLSFSGRVMAQSQRVTLDLKSCSIIEFFRTLQEKTSLYFIYNIKDLQGLDKISVKADNEPVEEILRRIFAGRKLDFNFDNNTVVVQPRQMQNSRIKGRITDTHKNPLPGVTIMIKGTTLGAVTDMDGNYSMELPAVKDIRLLYSFIGMKTQEVAYAGQKEINVTLHEEVAEMEEVVITGYQTVDRRKSTSSVTTRKMEDLHIPGISSLDQMLQGQIPDLIMMSNSGEVGVVPKLRIRGTSTLIGNREPLWVLDGIIMQDPVDVLAADLNDPDYINRVGNAIAGINPQDIERIDVLKDAAATALYGTRAANGVIVVTTKKGRVGRPIVSYNLSTTFRQRPAYSDRAINVMNSAERIRFSRDLVAQHYQFPTDMNLVGYEGLLTKLYNHELSDEQFAREVEQLETLNTDWFDLLTQNTVSHSHTVSISGGSSEANYYASIGYTRDNDVIWDDNNERYTAALNLNTNLTHWMRASLSVKGNVSSRRYYQQDLSPMQYAYNTTRALPAFDENGEYFYFLKRKPGGMEPQYFNYP
ncbi:MAG: SusC/RagA family TonB-linked outer membrane protein [Odoribacter splanchnicus]